MVQESYEWKKKIHSKIHVSVFGNGSNVPCSVCLSCRDKNRRKHGRKLSRSMLFSQQPAESNLPPSMTSSSSGAMSLFFFYFFGEENHSSGMLPETGVETSAMSVNFISTWCWRFWKNTEIDDVMFDWFFSMDVVDNSKTSKSLAEKLWSLIGCFSLHQSVL